MEPYLQVQDLALSDPLYRKILRRLQRKKGLPPGPILRDRLRLSGRYAAWRHRHRTDEKMPDDVHLLFMIRYPHSADDIFPIFV
jgi:hypothetical protein